jgi:homoserine kinase
LPIKNSVEVFAPASMGNVGVGFDILGLAFGEPGDIVRVEAREEPGVVILSIAGDDGTIPYDPCKNTAGVAVNAYVKAVDYNGGLGITIKKGLPLSGGLGGSAGSAVAAVVAANALLGEPMTREELLPFCMEGEALASGDYHADNIAPCLFGGITLATGIDMAHIRQLPVPEKLRFALVTPNVSVPTIEARSVLPQSILLKTMVAQIGAVAQLIDALYRGDVPSMAAAMEKDSVIEVARAHLMPHFYDARAEAKKSGALGLVISGAGPTLCAVCDSDGIARNVADSLSAFYDNAGIDAVSYWTAVDVRGARVLTVL